MATEPVKLFISHAPEDQALVWELRKHLATLEMQGAVSIWSPSDLPAGKDLRQAIDQHLAEAELVVFLVSASFLALAWSQRQVASAIDKRRLEGTAVVPIIVRHCDWADGPLGGLPALPRDGKPVTSWSNQDEAWTEVARSLRTMLQFGAEHVAPAPIAAPPLQIRPIGDIFHRIGPPDVTTSIDPGRRASRSP